MEIKISYIVKSLAGRDKGRLFIVVGLPTENYVHLSDGNTRRIEAPKKKKIKHVTFVSDNQTRVGDKIRDGAKITNAELRRTIADFGKAGQGTDDENNDRGDLLG